MKPGKASASVCVPHTYSERCCGLCTWFLTLPLSSFGVQHIYPELTASGICGVPKSHQAKLQQLRNGQIPGASGPPLPAAIRPCLCLLSICFLMAFMIREQSKSTFQPHLCTISFPFVFSFPPISQRQLPHSTGVIFEPSCFLRPVSRGWKMLFLTVNGCIVV